MTKRQSETIKNTSYGEMCYNKMYSIWQRLGYSREHVVTLLDWVAKQYSDPKDRSNFVYRNIIAGEASKDLLFSEFNTIHGTETFIEETIIGERDYLGATTDGESDDRYRRLVDAINATGERLGYKDAFQEYLRNNYSFQFMYGASRQFLKLFKSILCEELKKRFENWREVFEALPRKTKAGSFLRLCESVCTIIVSCSKKTKRLRESVIIARLTTVAFPAIDWLIEHGYVERQDEFLKVVKRYRAPRSEFPNTKEGMEREKTDYNERLARYIRRQREEEEERQQNEEREKAKASEELNELFQQRMEEEAKESLFYCI